MAESEIPFESVQAPLVSEEFLDLAEKESGISFIYAALNVVANRYQLRDAAVVLVNSSFGTQIFRLAGRAVNPEAVGGLGLSPGVYCVPDIVSRDDRDALYAACQSAYSAQYLRHNVAQHAVASEETASHPGPSWIVEPSRNDVAAMALTGRSARPWRRRVISSRGMLARAYFSRILLLVDIVTFAMTVAGVHGPVRLLFGLILGAVIPGWCIVAPLKLDNAALEFGLALSASLSLLMVVAQILITVKQWHLVALEEVTAAACFPFLLYHAMRPGRRSG